MSTALRPCPNPECNRGAITTMEPKPIGRCSNGEMVFSSHHMAPRNRVCDTCGGCGRIRIEGEAALVASPAPITYLGQPVNAPGFDQDQFTRAMARAFCDDLVVTPYHDGRYLVGCRHVYAYAVTRQTCDCKAGLAGMGCKHRAFLIAHLDIREPHVRREWAKLNREHPIRKAVAS